jgi:hypothetical protein
VILDVKTDRAMQAIGKAVRDVVSIISTEASPMSSQYNPVILLRDRDGMRSVLVVEKSQTSLRIFLFVGLLVSNMSFTLVV